MMTIPENKNLKNSIFKICKTFTYKHIQADIYYVILIAKYEI